MAIRLLTSVSRIITFWNRLNQPELRSTLLQVLDSYLSKLHKLEVYIYTELTADAEM